MRARKPCVLLLASPCWLALALGVACTTNETGSIDLAVASASKPPKPPMMPKPDPMTCESDGDCAKATPYCDEQLGHCVECLKEADCLDPHHPVCDPKSRKCVECTDDAGCGPPPMPPPKPPPP